MAGGAFSVDALSGATVSSNSTSRSVGEVMGAKTKAQHEAGIEDTVEAFYDDITVKGKGVLVATGSYSANPEMLAELNPMMDNIEILVGSGDGSGWACGRAGGPAPFRRDASCGPSSAGQRSGFLHFSLK